jgi:SRSO17 transposase
LDGLLGDERRKTGWMRAEAAGDPGLWRQQAILGRGHWDAGGLLDIVRDYVMEHLSDPSAVLVIDETGFLKQGKSSCGVSRQYTGSAGKVTNCQIGVFASYVSCHGHAFIDRALYIPKTWADDQARMTAAHVPDEVTFATKPALAIKMIKRAIGAGVPFAWVAADSVYGVGDVETALRRAGKGYVLGVSSSHHFTSWIGKPPVQGAAEAIAKVLAPTAWARLSAGEGTKGERLHDWAYCELADLDAAEYDETCSGAWTRGLLIRRNIADEDMAFFSTWCPAGTRMEALVKVEGHRRAIEDSFETAKNELGLDHNETRSWHGWHRHVTLVMLTFAMMAAIRRQANIAPSQKICDGQSVSSDPLVNPGNPAHRRSPRAKTNKTRPHYRMVKLAQSPPSRRSARSYQEENATVTLVYRDDSTLTTLICEDLARVDPCQAVVRAVGPNLLIALLMDGPQLGERWPGRYATVFAEDPGTSVLSFTSFGLIARQNDVGKFDQGSSIALWKDEKIGPRKLELHREASALVLELKSVSKEERTLDGRTDGATSLRWEYQRHVQVVMNARPDWIQSGVGR